MRRVVVTGMGAITPIGNSVDEFWKGIKEEKVGIAPISNFDTTEYKAKLSADVKGFDPKNYMDAKSAKRMDRFSQVCRCSGKGSDHTVRTGNRKGRSLPDWDFHWIRSWKPYGY